MRALWRAVLLFVVLGAVAGGTIAHAGVVAAKRTRLAPADQVALGSSFHAVRPQVSDFLASGDYLVSNLLNSSFHDAAPTLVNDRLGTTTALDPRCDAPALGPPWVLMQCPRTSDRYGPYDVELYSITDGTQRTVTPSPGLPQQCSSQPDLTFECANAVAVGAYWIRWDAICHNCFVTSFFQNIQTGQLLDDPTNATTFADLNSPTLAHTTCPGVRLIAQPHYPTPWGALTYDGQFALVTAVNSVFLERCGTRMRRPIGGEVSYDMASNAGAIVWQAVSVNPSLTGLLMPGLQRFTIPLPSAIVRPSGSPGDVLVNGLGLTTTGLYVRDGWNGTVWRAASPAALPFNTSRPSLIRSRNTLTCRRGSWQNAGHFSYAWQINSITRRGASHTLTIGKTRRPRSVSCSLTAFNAAGTTTAASAQLHLR